MAATSVALNSVVANELEAGSPTAVRAGMSASSRSGAHFETPRLCFISLAEAFTIARLKQNREADFGLVAD